MENTITPEQITAHVAAAFDSVTLVTLNQENAETIERNVSHLRIMMEKEWFAQALTAEQREQINNIINE